MQDSSERAEKVVLAGNIRRFSLVLPRRGKPLFLQRDGRRDDDVVVGNAK